MKTSATINQQHLSYEIFDIKLSTYENILKKLGNEIHLLSPSHPIRQYLKKLIQEIKDLPEDKLHKYFERRKNDSL